MSSSGSDVPAQFRRIIWAITVHLRERYKKNSHAGWYVGNSLLAIYKNKCDKKTIFWSKKDKWFPLRIAVKDKLIGVLTLMRRTPQLLRQMTFIKNDIALVPLNKLIWHIHFRFWASPIAWFELQWIPCPYGNSGQFWPDVFVRSMLI